MIQKPVRKPHLERGCGACFFKEGDFSKDTVNPSITRVYCKARHFSVDAQVMSKDCDFFKISPDYEHPEQDKINQYGL